MSQSDDGGNARAPNSAPTVVGFPTDGNLDAVPSAPATDHAGWPPRPPEPSPTLPQKTAPMAVVAPLSAPLAPPPSEAGEDDEEEEPQTEPRPDVSGDDAPSRSGHLEEKTAALPVAAAPRGPVGKTLLIDSEASSAEDEDTQKQRRRDRARTVMMPEPTPTRRGGTHAMPRFPEPTSEGAAVEARPRPRAGTIAVSDFVPDEVGAGSSPRARAATLKSPESAAEIAALRKQYAGAIRMPEIATVTARDVIPAPGPLEAPPSSPSPGEDDAVEPRRAREGTMEIQAVTGEHEGAGARVDTSDAVASSIPDTLPQSVADSGAKAGADTDSAAPDTPLRPAWIPPEQLESAGFRARHRAPSSRSLAGARSIATPHASSSRRFAEALADDEEDGTGDDAPAAMRPIGRLGGDDGGAGMSLDFLKPGKVVDDDDLPPSQRPPPLPGGHTCEADRLDAWLDSMADAGPDPISMDIPATRAPGTMDVAAVFADIDERPLPFRGGEKAVPPSTSPIPANVRLDHAAAEVLALTTASLSPRGDMSPATQSFSLPAPAPLPFTGHGVPVPAAELDAAPVTPTRDELPAPTGALIASLSGALPFDDSEADRLELWLRHHLDDRAQPQVQAAPTWSPPPPMEPRVAIAPNPIVDARLPTIVRQAPAPESQPRSQAPVLSVEDYAKIKVAVWDRGLDLLEALEEQGIEEPVWRDNELRMADALAREAQDGEAVLAGEVRRAIRALRAREDETEDLLSLERYAEIRVALEMAAVIDEAEPLVLARHELSPETWERTRAEWAKRARREPSLARQVRRAVAKARRTAKAKQRAEDAGTSPVSLASPP